MEIPDWQTPLAAPVLVPRSTLFMKLHGPSDFVRIINGQSPRPHWRLLDFRERFWAARVGLITSGAHVLVKHAKEVWGLKRAVPVTLDPIALSVVSQEYAPVELHTRSSNEVHIVNVGRLEHRKGQHIVCRSLSMLVGDLPPWRLHFVGPDTDTGPGGSSYRDYCLSLVPAELRERVSWHPPVDLGVLSSVYGRADVVLISSLDGNYGYTTLHPLAAGSCVISTLEPGCSDSAYIVHGVDGYLYPSTDASVLASLLSDLVADPERRALLRSGAMRRAASELDPAVVASRVLHDLAGG
ncbi:glycosyltransferase family 4 protein [Nocardioides sp. P5_E3]